MSTPSRPNTTKRLLLGACVILSLTTVIEGLWIWKLQHSQSSVSPDGWNTPFHRPHGFFDDWDDLSSQLRDLEQQENSMMQWSFDSSWAEPKRVDKNGEIDLVFNLKGHEKANCTAKVVGHEITVTASESTSSQWSQTVQIPIPEDADPQNFQIQRTKDEFIIIFKKATTSSPSTPLTPPPGNQDDETST